MQVQRINNYCYSNNTNFKKQQSFTASVIVMKSAEELSSIDQAKLRRVQLLLFKKLEPLFPRKAILMISAYEEKGNPNASPFYGRENLTLSLDAREYGSHFLNSGRRYGERGRTTSSGFMFDNNASDERIVEDMLTTFRRLRVHNPEWEPRDWDGGY